MLHKSTASPLPDYDSPSSLAQDFANFFDSKIEKIYQHLNSIDDTEQHSLPEPESHSLLWSFTVITEKDILKIIAKSPIKFCQLDPIPAAVFKEVYIPLIPELTALVNLSLKSGTMPSDMEVALINPILKKPQLDKEVLSNYRPVSNLTYVSKLIERVIAKQLVDHLESNNLAEIFQSAYKQYHSTETALTFVTNDILTALDQKQAVLLVLLDLSAAFDTVDHRVLLRRLEVRVSLRDVALQWMESYLTHRHQHVSVGGGKSSSQELKWGVPQGSVLGPILF